MSGPRLLLVAHGTASIAGRRTLDAVHAAVRHSQSCRDVDLCFLDVCPPRLPDVLDDRPTVLVPLLLSTGYHVQADIPAAIAARPGTRATAHLGPDPLVIDALADRLGPVDDARSVLLVSAGSSRPGATVETHRTAELLAERLGRPVAAQAVGPQLDAAIAALPGPVAVATHLLAEGRFSEQLAAAVAGRGTSSAPIGAHPALVRLIGQRYETAARDL